MRCGVRKNDISSIPHASRSRKPFSWRYENRPQRPHWLRSVVFQLRTKIIRNLADDFGWGILSRFSLLSDASGSHIGCAHDWKRKYFHLPIVRTTNLSFIPYMPKNLNIRHARTYALKRINRSPDFKMQVRPRRFSG